MKELDMRFNQNIFSSFINKKMKKYKCDPFVYTSSVHGMVGLYIDDKIYEINNEQESVDYFGVTDDYAVFKFHETTDDNVKSLLKGVEQITTKIDKKIKKIVLVNENQQMFENEIQIYNVWLTRAIIFFFEDGKELMFQKDITPFSEEIDIRKGYELIKEIPSQATFLEGWNKGVTPKCNREIITLD